MTNFLFLSVAVLIISIVAIRLMPSPERTVHAHGEWFGDTHDTDNEHGMKIVFADTDKFVVHERQGSGCKSDDWDHFCSPPYHYHTFQHEDFEVLEGSMNVMVDGEVMTLHKGDTATIPPGAKHTFTKHGDEDLLARVTLRTNPDGVGQRFFPNLFGSIRDSGGKPSPVQVLYLFCNHGVRLADIPKPIHELMCLATNAVAPLLGYSLEYKEYPFQ